jgi:hypothetical protein
MSIFRALSQVSYNASKQLQGDLLHTSRSSDLYFYMGGTGFGTSFQPISICVQITNMVLQFEMSPPSLPMKKIPYGTMPSEALRLYSCRSTDY